MEYIKSTPSNLTNPIESKDVTLIWSTDGWCYIPQLKTRQKFTETHFFHEDWDGIIGMPAHTEQITWILYSKEPRVWREQGEQHDELYHTKPNKKANTPLVPAKRFVQRRQRLVK